MPCFMLLLMLCFMDLKDCILLGAGCVIGFVWILLLGLVLCGCTGVWCGRLFCRGGLGTGFRDDVGVVMGIIFVSLCWIYLTKPNYW